MFMLSCTCAIIDQGYDTFRLKKNQQANVSLTLSALNKQSLLLNSPQTLMCMVHIVYSHKPLQKGKLKS